MDLVALFQDDPGIRSLRPGEILVEEGSHGEVLFVVLDGEVEVRVGGRHILVAGPGEVLGEMALVSPGPRSASAVARTPCRVAVVNEKRFLFMVSQTPFFALHIMRVLVERLRRADGWNEPPRPGPPVRRGPNHQPKAPDQEHIKRWV